MKRTPGPWKIDKLQTSAIVTEQDEYGFNILIAEIYTGDLISDAEFIVQACNNYDDLLAACKTAIDIINTKDYYNDKKIGKIKAAIVQAKSGIT